MTSCPRRTYSRQYRCTHFQGREKTREEAPLKWPSRTNLRYKFPVKLLLILTRMKSSRVSWEDTWKIRRVCRDCFALQFYLPSCKFKWYNSRLNYILIIFLPILFKNHVFIFTQNSLNSIYTSFYLNIFLKLFQQIFYTKHRTLFWKKEKRIYTFVESTIRNWTCWQDGNN